MASWHSVSLPNAERPCLHCRAPAQKQDEKAHLIRRSGGRGGDGCYSTKAAAKLLNVSTGTVTRWCRLGKLNAIQGVPFGPHWIRLTPEIIAKLRKPVQ